MQVRLTLNIPLELAQQLETAVVSTGQTKTAIIVAGIKKELEAIDNKQE